MKTKIGIVVSVLLVVLIVVTAIFLQNRKTGLNPENSFAQTNVVAFPGAKGFGSSTEGGRYGKVLEVTNLNDTLDTNNLGYIGSFRWALNTSWSDDINDPYDQRRVIVFKVAGRIPAVDKLVVNKPFTTIAGQTAPGTGIAISGAPLSVETHDVIVRGLRLRVGDDAVGEDYGSRDGLKITVPNNSTYVYNVVLDHNSVSWAIDENMSIYDGSSTKDHVSNVTFSNNIITEALYCSLHTDKENQCSSSPAKYGHSMGFLIGAKAQYISVIGNLFASNGDRNPYITGGTKVEFINNVVYNWDHEPTKFDSNGVDSPIFANVIGNYYKSTPISDTDVKGVYTKCDTPVGSKIYLYGNVGPGRLTDTGDQWLINTFKSGCAIPNVRVDNFSFPLSSGVVPTAPLAAWDSVLSPNGAGALPRDSVDTRAVNTTKSGSQPASGKWLVDSPSDVGGWPTYSGTSYVDSDHDGMPDSWEISKGYDPNNYADRNILVNTGYTRLEDYINSFFGGTENIETNTGNNTETNTGTNTETQTPPPAVDKYSPKVRITSPSVSIYTRNIGSVLKIKASASDDVGIKRVTFFVNGVKKCSDYTPTYKCNWAIPLKRYKTYKIVARAVDFAGHRKDSKPIYIYVR